MGNIRLKLKDFDWLLFFVAFFLILAGIVAIYVSAFKPGVDVGLPKNAIAQGAFALVGLGVFFVVSFTDYRLVRNFSLIFYLVTLALLILVLVYGEVVGGATRWIDLGLFRFQPSEIMKLALILVLAWYFSSNVRGRERSFKPFLVSIAIVLVPTLVVFAQPDLGTALVYGAIWFGMVLVSQINKIYVFLLGAAGAALAPVAWLALKDYQKNRILTFLNPYTDPSGAGWNVIQSTIAVGSGRVTGKKYTLSQSLLNFLPAQHTDFIFATLAEKMGFLGAAIVIGLFLAMLLRAIRAIKISQETFGMFLATGVTFMILFQAVINIGMNMGIAPVTGIPLPFVSYGGTSLIVSLLALGLLQSVIVHHRKIKF